MEEMILNKKVLAVFAISMFMISIVAVAVPVVMADSCTKIQDGVLTYSAGHYLEGQPLTVGYDPYGYNYQAHMFNGYYCNAYLGGYGFPPYEGDAVAYLDENPDAVEVWCWSYRDVKLVMKWNDAWLSNKDCNEDGKLDRHFGHTSYIGSDAWETNYQYGTYEVDGNEYCWNYFVKIVALDEMYDHFDDANGNNNADDYELVYDSENNLLGQLIWGSFVIIQQVYNDQGTGENGIEFLAPPSGFGSGC